MLQVQWWKGDSVDKLPPTFPSNIVTKDPDHSSSPFLISHTHSIIIVCQALAHLQQTYNISTAWKWSLKIIDDYHEFEAKQ